MVRACRNKAWINEGEQSENSFFLRLSILSNFDTYIFSYLLSIH